MGKKLVGFDDIIPPHLFVLLCLDGTNNYNRINFIHLQTNAMLMGSTPKTNSGRLKLLVEIIAITEKVSRYLPIIVFAYTGLTLIFAIINILGYNIVLGIILFFFAGFGLYLTVRIVLTRRRWRQDSQTYAITSQK
jgi:hypothetical protein